jgi:hypothetical protein
MADNQLPGTGPKSFFERPEGKVALIPPILLAIALFWFWGEVSDFVVHAVDNLLHLIVTAVGIFAILWLLFDRKFRMFLWYMYRSGMRALTHAFVSSDDLGVLKTYLEKMKSKRDEFQRALNDLTGQKIETDKQIKQDTRDYNEACNMFAAAKKATPPNLRVADLQAKQMDRLSRVLEGEQADFKTLLKITTVLSGYRDTCDDAIADWSEEIKIQEREQRRSNSFRDAMRAGLSIMRGMPEDEEMRDMALEDLKQKYAAKMGEVEQAFDMTRAVVSTAQIKDSAAIEKANKMLDDWESKKQIGPGNTVTQLSPVEAPVESQQSIGDSGYSDLFK